MKDAANFPETAPITLIDGDKLMALLLKHGIGVKKRQITLIKIDESTLANQVAGNKLGISPPDEFAHLIE